MRKMKFGLKNKIVALFTFANLSVYAEWKLIGDVNNDKMLGNADVILLCKILIGQEAMPNDISTIDVNGDKKLSIGDITTLIDLLVNPEKQKEIWISEDVSIGGKQEIFD